jgi:hypothetical protein
MANGIKEYNTVAYNFKKVFPLEGLWLLDPTYTYICCCI